MPIFLLLLLNFKKLMNFIRNHKYDFFLGILPLGVSFSHADRKRKDRHDVAITRILQMLWNAPKMDCTNYCGRIWTGLLCDMVGISGVQ